MRESNLCATLIVGAILASCSGSEFEAPRKLTGSAMGTSYMLSLACDLDADAARETAEAAFNRVDRAMSGYRTDSELMAFNRSALGQWHPISRDFGRVVASALEVAEQSDGAFDPTIGALVDLWGFGAEARSDSLPEAAEIDSLRQLTGVKYLQFDEVGLALRRLAEFSLDLSAIAKGYAVDLALAELTAKSCEDLLVEVGGEVAARGLRPDGSDWRVGVESPGSSATITHTLALHNEAVATSGDYRNFSQFDGKRYSHTIDPATGRPVTHALASVSVVATSAMRADALATALNVMGPVEGLLFASTIGVDALFITRTENGYDSFGTGRFGAQNGELVRARETAGAEDPGEENE